MQVTAEAVSAAGVQRFDLAEPDIRLYSLDSFQRSDGFTDGPGACEDCSAKYASSAETGFPPGAIVLSHTPSEMPGGNERCESNMECPSRTRRPSSPHRSATFANNEEYPNGAFPAGHVEVPHPCTRFDEESCPLIVKPGHEEHRGEKLLLQIAAHRDKRRFPDERVVSWKMSDWP